MAGQGPGQKRVMKEFADLSSNPPTGITVTNSDDLYKWKVTIDGPAGTPYAGGKFDVDLTLPPTYPFKPPTVQFSTKIYHPNISNDSPPNSGTMCLGMLREAEWKPATKMSSVLTFAQNLLAEPNLDDPVEAKIADQIKTDRPSYEKEAKEWTKRYAVAKK